jgi:molybdate/tungstate transport system substrate-binding protein
MKRFSLLIALAALLALTAAFPALAATKLAVFHAGSLAAPMAEIEALYEKAHPDVDIQRESGGSAALARKIIDLGGQCDLFLSADYMVIERLLRPAAADFNVLFASNELVLMYGPEARYAKEINGDNWHEILMKDDVRWGHSDPEADPCGYRSLMVLQLAEKHYGVAGFYEKALAHPLRAVRPKAIDLVAMVESGAMDYAFEYRSVAIQHGFEYVELPVEINLKEPAHADFYATAVVERSGAEPGTKILTKGEPVVYGLTIPKGAPQQALAEDFASFVLSPDGGLAVFEKMGQAIVGPSAYGEAGAVPESLRGRLK